MAVVGGSETEATGGGIANYGVLSVTNSTFSGNQAPAGDGGAIQSAAPSTVTNSIFANSTGGNCSGSIVNGGYNISDDSTCGFGSSTAVNGKTIGDDVSDSDLALASAGLANNGGPTETIALEPGSYALDAIPIADCPSTDQRGDPRPAPGHNACDIGAFELQDAVPFARFVRSLLRRAQSQFRVLWRSAPFDPLRQHQAGSSAHPWGWHTPTHSNLQ
jgi:hypothetical protein